MERSSPPLFSWLHLSDIHFGQGQGTEHAHRELVLDTFLSNLRQIHRWNTPQPDAVFVTGDIGFSGDVLGRGEYAQAAKWLHALSRQLSLKPQDIYMVPGNHDVPRVTEGADAPTFQLIQELRTQKRRLDDVLNDENAHRLLEARMRNYLAFAAPFGPAAVGGGSRNRLFWSHRLKTRGNLSLRIAGLNTALLANDDSDSGQLWLGLRQLNEAFHQQEENELIIALSHHPPEWLGDGNTTEKWLEARAHLLLSGHVHEQESWMRQRGGGRRFVHVAAGALHEVTYDPHSPESFTFSFGAIREGDDGRLQLQVWPFTWTKLHEFRPGPNHLQTPGHHFTIHPLECPAPSRVGPGTATKAPEPGALAEALTDYKRARAKDSRIRRLDLSRLVGITRGPAQTELDLLDIVVAPSLQDGAEEYGERAAKLRRQQRAPDLTPSERREIGRELARLEQGGREHQGHPHGQQVELISFAEALHRHRRLTVIGEPGAGKSVLTRLALLACTDGEVGKRARERLLSDDEFSGNAARAIQSLCGLLPVRLTLGEFGRELAADQRLSLPGFIRRQLLEQKAGPKFMEALEELFDTGKIFLLCDGLDEAPEAQRERVVQALVTLAEQTPETRILVTSRPHGYHPRVSGFAHTRLAPLHYRQQRVLVSRLHQLVETARGEDAQGVARARRRTEALLQVIQTRREWYELSSNPLLLTLSALMNTDENDVPKHRIFVFENFVRTLLLKWRATLPPSSAEMNRLLDAWSSVAAELVRSDRRYGVERGRILHMLTRALNAVRVPAPIDAETALHLALESGLVREDDETVAFWHSTFAEFLAARALTEDAPNAAQRILEAANLSPLVLRLAAARLGHVFDDEDGAAALANGLLARDDSHAGRLFRPGLRAVSECIRDGVGFRADVVERVWSTWAELLEQTPPSPLWNDFEQLTQQAPRARLPVALAARFARIDDRGVYEARVGLARIVAPAAGEDATARAACEHWLRQTSVRDAKLHAAFGLACAGVWTEPVIEALGRFSSEEKLDPDTVGGVVRRAGAPLLDQLRALIRKRGPSKESPSGSERPDEKGLSDLRLSAARLLATAGQWSEEVIEVMRLALSDHALMRQYEAKAVLRHHAAHAPVRKALLHWLADGSTLGAAALELVRDVAPRVEHMPNEVLELTATAKGNQLQELESLLVSIGEERRTLIDTLRRWLGEAREERGRRAARILLRLAPNDHLLHEALRRGMRSPDDATRAYWAQLSFGLDDELTRTALETKLGCTRSPDPVARETAYDGMFHLMEWSKWKPFDEWFKRVSDPLVPAVARLDAAKFVARQKLEKAGVIPLLRELLDTAEEEVGRQAALLLFDLHEVDTRIASIAAEDTVRKGHYIGRLDLLQRFATTIVPVILRTLSKEVPPTDDTRSRRLEPEDVWPRVLEKLAAAEPSCVNALLDAMEYPAPARTCAVSTLHLLVKEQAPVREVIRQHLQRPMEEVSRNALLLLIGLGLEHEETKPSALQALRALDPRHLDQSRHEWLARRLDQEQDAEDAIRLWRLALDGEDLEISLRAAMALAVDFPDDAKAWLQPAITRLLGSPHPFHRVDAARVALRCGLLEQEALETLFACLEIADPKYKREEKNDLIWYFGTQNEIVHGPIPRDGDLFMLQGHGCSVDMEAMHALCIYRPDVGLSRLTAWLDAEEIRFTSAVEVLAKRGVYRDKVRATLEERLRSVSLDRIGSITHLVDRHRLHSARMMEVLLTRYTPKMTDFDDVQRDLRAWLKRHPDYWAVLLRQEPARRVELGRLLRYELPANADAISFAIGLALSHPHDPIAEIAEVALENWCTPSQQDEAASAERSERPPSLSPEEARALVREMLSAQATPREFFTLLLFDKLAELGGLSTERRTEVLLRVLDIDLTRLMSEELSLEYLLQQQVSAGLRLLELGSRDEHLQPFLESAMRLLAGYSTDQVFKIARALPRSRLVEPAMRQLLIQGAVRPVGYPTPQDEDVLDLLADVGLSPTELVDVQLTRVGLDVRPEWTALRDAPGVAIWSASYSLFDALDHLHCPPERRAEIHLDLATRYENKLSAWMKLELAARADLPDPVAAKLLLSMIAARDLDRRQAMEQWRERFSPRNQEGKEERRPWAYRNDEFLSRRLGMMAKLSEMRNPALLDEALSEWVASPPDGFRQLYREARDDKDSLSDARWLELTNQLSIQPNDEATTRLAKEWLTLGLWQAAEPRKFDEL